MRYEAAGTLRGFLKQGELATATVTKSPKHGLELAFGLRRPGATPLAGLGLAESIVSVDVEAGGREAPWAPATSSTPGRRVDGRAVRCACAARDGSRRLVIEVARRSGVDDDAFSESTKCALSYALRADGRDSAAAPTDVTLEIEETAAPPHVRFEAIKKIHRDLIEDHKSRDTTLHGFQTTMNDQLSMAGAAILQSPTLMYRDERDQVCVPCHPTNEPPSYVLTSH